MTREHGQGTRSSVTEPSPSSVSASLQSLSLDAKVGQLFVAGFDGTRPTPGIESLITERQLGGIIYFARNIETPAQLRQLSDSLQGSVPANVPPLFVAIDQEGGRVTRLPWETQLPSAMAIGAANDASIAEAAGEAVGRELRRLGISVNLAPVLDVNRADNPVIGARSFGDRPASVAELGTAFAAGLREATVVACGKHFPGHGDTTVDSHLDLPRVDHARDHLDCVDLRPFRAALNAGIDMLMTAHVAYPALGTTKPATVSQSVVTGLLRDELGFEGLVVTDCMEMDAIADTVGTVEGSVQAIEAGCDLITISHSLDLQHAAIDAVIDAVESDRLSEDRIDASVRRILRAKRAYTMGVGGSTDWLSAARNCRTVAQTIAEHSVTIVRDDTGRLPIPTDEPVAVYEFEKKRGSLAETDVDSSCGPFASALSTAGVDVTASTLPLSSDALDSVTPSRSDTKGPTIVCISDVRAHPVQAAVIRKFAEIDGNQNPDSVSDSDLDSDSVQDVHPIVVAVRAPYDLSAFPDGVAMTTYDDTPASLAAGARVLIGDLSPTGRLPITIPDDGRE